MTRVGEGGGGGCSLDTQRIMAESECRVDEVTGGSESSELDYSFDLFFEEEEGPVIPEGPSDNHLPVRAYRYEPYLALDLMRFPRLQRFHPGTKLSLSATDFKTPTGKSILYLIP